MKTQVRNDQNNLPNAKAGTKWKRGKENYNETYDWGKFEQISTKHSSQLPSSQGEKGQLLWSVEFSLSCSRRHFRPRGTNVCLLLTTERTWIQESLHKVVKKGKEKNDPRVAFMMDAEALPIWLLFKLISIWEHQQLLPHCRVTVWKITWQWRMCVPGLALTLICCVTLDHTFTHSVPWVSPLLKEGPLQF